MIDRRTRRNLQARLDEIASETKEIKDLLKRDERETFVVVQFSGNAAKYTYTVDQPCRVGDYCVVYSPRSGRDEFVRVVELGRGSWRFGETKVAKRVGTAAWLYARLIESIPELGPTTRIYGYSLDQILDALDFAKTRGWVEPTIGAHHDHVHVSVQVPSNPTIPPGRHQVVCAALEDRVSRATGRPYLMATHAVITGQHAGTLLHQPLLRSDTAAWIWNDAVEDPSELVGKILLADVTTEAYEHTRRSRVGKLWPYPLPDGFSDEDDVFRGSDV